MACQVPQRVGTSYAELYFHVHPPRAKQWEFCAGTNLVCRSDKDVFRPPVSWRLRLNLFNWDRGHLVTCNRLFRPAARLGAWGLLAQSYVGKRAVLKGIGGSIRKFIDGITRSACKRLIS